MSQSAQPPINTPDLSKLTPASQKVENKRTPQTHPPKPKPKFGSAKGMFVMAPDFDEPLEDFKEYMH